MVEVLLQMKLAWLEVEVVAENEKAENMEQIEDVAIGDDQSLVFGMSFLQLLQIGRAHV